MFGIFLQHKRKANIVLGIIILLVAGFFFFGCAPSQLMIEDHLKATQSARDISRDLAEDFLISWPMISGAIDGLFRDRLDELPGRTIDAKKRLDELAKQDTWTDWELGEAGGLGGNIFVSVVKEALKMFRPDLLDLIPVIFL